MVTREFKIKCPMCEGLLIIDARNGKLVRHFEPGENEDDKPDPAKFDEALGKIDRVKEEGDNMFADAMKKVEDRKKGLDDLFKDAKDKADEKGDEDRPEDHPDFWQ